MAKKMSVGEEESKKKGERKSEGRVNIVPQKKQKNLESCWVSLKES